MRTPWLGGLLKEYEYDAKIIHISDFFSSFNKKYKNDKNALDVYSYYEKAMNEGDSIRKALDTNDALARKAIGEIANLRNPRNKRSVYVIYSLKKSEEIDTLRAVYNELFGNYILNAPS